MSINAQIENMPVHLINRRSRQNRRAPELQAQISGTSAEYVAFPRFQSTHAGEVKPEAPDDKTAAWTERRAWINPQQTSYEDLMYIYS